MQKAQTISDLRVLISKYKAENKSIGFVPTMGALHEGHMSLVHAGKSQNDVTVVSIFVNPTQFNDPTDLINYPRTVDQDLAMLEAAGVDAVFIPSVDEMYPETDTRVFDFGLLEQVMEGKYRPNHFNGVAQIVSKLFDMVKPDRTYFGEKDFQQLAIVKQMVRMLGMEVEIVPVPIMREASGLAMSSRNTRLSEEQHVAAANIYKVLLQSKSFFETATIKETIDFVTESLSRHEQLRLEYFEIVDGHTLQPVTDPSHSDSIVGCVAVFCGDVRLIDNIRYTINTEIKCR